MTLKFNEGWIKLQLAFFKYLYSTSKQMKLEIPFPAWAAMLLEWGLLCHATYFHFFDFFFYDTSAELVIKDKGQSHTAWNLQYS